MKLLTNLSHTKLRHEHKIISLLRRLPFFRHDFAALFPRQASDGRQNARQTWNKHGKREENLFSKVKIRMQNVESCVSPEKNLFSSFPCNKNLILDINFLQLLNLILVEYFLVESLSKNVRERGETSN
jgi:hypothetical protein